MARTFIGRTRHRAGVRSRHCRRIPRTVTPVVGRDEHVDAMTEASNCFTEGSPLRRQVVAASSDDCRRASWMTARLERGATPDSSFDWLGLGATR